MAPDETSFNDIKQALLNGQLEDDQGQSASEMVDPYSLQTLTNILNTDSNVSEADFKSGRRVNAQYLNDFMRDRQRHSDGRTGEEESKTNSVAHYEYGGNALDIEFPEAKHFAEFEQQRRLPG